MASSSGATPWDHVVNNRFDMHSHERQELVRAMTDYLGIDPAQCLGITISIQPNGALNAYVLRCERQMEVGLGG